MDLNLKKIKKRKCKNKSENIVNGSDLKNKKSGQIIILMITAILIMRQRIMMITYLCLL